VIQIKLADMSMTFQGTKLHLSKCNGPRVLSVKLNMYFNIQQPTMFVFLVYHKSGITKSCSSSKDLSAYTILLSYVEWCKFRIHLSSLKKTALFKRSVKENNYSKGCIYPYLSLYKTSFVWVQRFISCRHETNYIFENKPPAMIVFSFSSQKWFY
jgi:hypothetical protein